MESTCVNGTGPANGSAPDRSPACSEEPHAVTPAQFYFEVILLLVTIGIGLFANAAAIVVIVLSKSMHTGTFLMLGNLCLNGLLLAAVCMPLHLTSVIQGRWTMGDVMCQVEGYMIATCALSSAFTHTMVAVLRYLAVGSSQRFYSKMSATSSILVWLTVGWLLAGVLVGTGRSIGLVRTEFVPLYSRCTPINMRRLFDVVVSGSVIIVTCYVIITSSYICLFVVIRKKVRNLSQGHKMSRQNDRFVKITKTLVVLSFVFIICWLPFIIMCGADPHHNKFSAFVHRMGHDIAEIMSCINPIFYFMRIESFKKAFKCGRRPIENRISTTSRTE